MLTREKAIEECKELWHRIEDSGMCKAMFINKHEDARKWIRRNYKYHCPLCEYIGTDWETLLTSKCNKCPLVKQYGKNCKELGFDEFLKPSQEWLEAIYNLK